MMGLSQIFSMGGIAVGGIVLDKADKQTVGIFGGIFATVLFLVGVAACFVKGAYIYIYIYIYI